MRHTSTLVSRRNVLPWVGASHEANLGDEIHKVWVEYKTTGDKVLRNKLAEHYLGFVRSFVRRLFLSRYKKADLGMLDAEEMMEFAIIGLFDAIEKFDPKLGVRFETYCSSRLRGAISDGARNTDSVSRSIRQRIKIIQKIKIRFYSKNGRDPTDEEIQNILNVSDQKYQKIITDSRKNVVSLSQDMCVGDSGKKLTLMNLLTHVSIEKTIPEIDEPLLSKEIGWCLSKREQAVMVMYYCEKKRMKAISKILGVSESCVSLIHTAAIKRIRNYFKKKHCSF